MSGHGGSAPLLARKKSKVTLFVNKMALSAKKVLRKDTPVLAPLPADVAAFVAAFVLEVERGKMVGVLDKIRSSSKHDTKVAISQYRNAVKQQLGISKMKSVDEKKAAEALAAEKAQRLEDMLQRYEEGGHPLAAFGVGPQGGKPSTWIKAPASAGSGDAPPRASIGRKSGVKRRSTAGGALGSGAVDGAPVGEPKRKRSLLATQGAADDHGACTDATSPAPADSKR